MLRDRIAIPDVECGLLLPDGQSESGKVPVGDDQLGLPEVRTNDPQLAGRKVLRWTVLTITERKDRRFNKGPAAVNRAWYGKENQHHERDECNAQDS